MALQRSAPEEGAVTQGKIAVNLDIGASSTQRPRRGRGNTCSTIWAQAPNRCFNAAPPKRAR